MFGSKNEKTTGNNAAPSANSSNSIVDGTHIKGDIVASNDIRIDGTLIGKLDCKGRVILGAQGKIEGDITCINAIIEGTFTGNLDVKELLTVKETGVVNGDIRCDKLFIQTGAVFNTTCTMGGQKLKPLVNKEPSQKVNN
ncbi:MAG: polymer-forming cytoskeletal protein [Saprospiraceae bacterium]|nr:MAG: Integral membrane protein CcmA involved in cell shape determination [Bacteroidetes bacterium OLB9]MCO6464161.1 polymer-forming cytoskeletal protein [Saprospiraceae bacterium]MCZ2339603.1 polymer-forming cytoskeletal protein [Chitinophagales bacterium]